MVTPPVDDVTKHGPKAGEPEVTKEEIPYETKRVLDPTMEPGSPDKVAQKVKMVKNNNNTNYN